VPSAQCPILKWVSLRVNTCFSSSYLSEWGFSTLKIPKSKYISSLTDKHINDCVRVAITKYTPNYNKLAEEMQCQVSHWIAIIKGKCMFWFYSNESGFSTMKILKSEYRLSLTDKCLNVWEWLLPNTLLTIIAGWRDAVSSTALNSITLFRHTIFLREHYTYSYCIFLHRTRLTTWFNTWVWYLLIYHFSCFLWLFCGFSC